MPQEIERKFLVANDGWRGGADRGKRLRQAYLAQTDRLSVRVRIEDDTTAALTIKSAEAGLSRLEFEYPMPLADAEALLALRQGSVLVKTRFRARHVGREWEVDVYSGDNRGLVVAEIEIESEGEPFEFPPWVGAEVTHDPRYYASRLAQQPFGEWAGADAESRDER